MPAKNAPIGAAGPDARTRQVKLTRSRETSYPDRSLKVNASGSVDLWDVPIEHLGFVMPGVTYAAASKGGGL